MSETATLPEGTADLLLAVVARAGTPSFAYFPTRMRARLQRLEAKFGGRVTVSFAMKCNPNVGLLRALSGPLTALDASSAGEIHRGLQAGYAAHQIAFSGPAKRDFEIDYAVRIGCGSIICESIRQVESVDAAARRHGRRQQILLRINPNRVPKKFGLQMGGRPSQFGIDEDAIHEVLGSLSRWPSVECVGLHVFSAGNSLDESAIAENFAIIAELFSRLVVQHNLDVDRLVFGSGFGIPYFADDQELDLDAIVAEVNPVLDELRRNPRLGRCRFMLEMGRWLVGSDGYLLASVVDAKGSRNTDILLCDAGFNNHLSACGMMGTVMRRNWRFWNLSRRGKPSTDRYLLVGPLCASFDVLGSNVELPTTEPGDVIAVGSSGAYGLTASPTRFISHPEPREMLVETDGAEARFTDVTESTLNQLESHGNVAT